MEHLAKFFQHYHQDAFMLIAIQNPFRLLIFSCVLISDKIERILKKKKFFDIIHHIHVHV